MEASIQNNAHPPKSAFSWKRVLSLAGNRRGTLALIVVIIILEACLSPLTPLIMAQLIDSYIGQSKYSLENLLLAFMGLSILRVGLYYLQNVLTVSFTSQIVLNLRNELYGCLQNQSVRFFTETKSGEILSRLTTEANTVGEGIFMPLLGSTQSLLSLIATIIMMMVLQWKLAVLILAVTPILFLPLPLFGAFAYRISKQMMEKNVAMSSYLTETLTISGVMLIKLFGGKEAARRSFGTMIEAIRKYTVKQSVVGGIYTMFFALGTAIAPILVFWFGRNGGGMGITAGTALAFSSYIATLFNPLQQISQINIMLQGAKVMCERIFNYIDALPEIIKTEKPIELSRIKGLIEFENITFEYSRGSKVLQDVSFTIHEKEKIAIVGYSGSGKTTVAYLLTRLFDPTSGQIRIDGINLQHIDPDEINRHIGMVSQEIFLLHSSIRENLLIANKDATDEQIVQAAKDAQIHEKIMSLPDGYLTVTGERGYKLSGGEKQRIAIARIFLKNPSILILDEATSALDVHSESLVQEALNKLVQERTVLTITHRLSGVSAYDRILVLDQGRIVEMGTHEELSQNHGLYMQFYERIGRKVAIGIC